MIGWLVRAILAAWFLAAPCAVAHEIRPAYLQIDQTDTHAFDVLWKVPSRGNTVLDIQPEFDAGFHLTKAGMEALLDGFVVYRYRLTGEKELAGSKVTIRDLGQTTIDVLANIRLLGGESHTFFLHPNANSTVIPSTATTWGVLSTYTLLGVEHILFGIDHLLFVLALVMLTKGFGRLVKTITAFTVAHSITLSLAVLGFVQMPGPPVEAAIALSIVFLALEILRVQNGEKTLTGAKPWLVAFAFGLLHGLGFAGALSDIGLPQTDIPLALASFNIGVELGQLAFVCGVLVTIRALNIVLEWPRAVMRIPAYAIGTISTFWVIDRIWAFAA
jgi:hydrogenase/urease accessory protein HupE